MAATAPVIETGYQVANPYYWWLYQDETTPELIWPQSVYVYDLMRHQDAQIKSVLQAVIQPVLSTPWRIDPNGARKEVVELVSDDLGLPIVGQNPKPPLRTKDKFSWTDHLAEALLMLPFGYSYFEQVYRITDGGTRAHLRKLALRPAKSIQKINVASDGGLVSIEQYWAPSDGEMKPIPVNHLVAYIYGKEGGNWLGTSVLRPVYKNWLLKDRLLRVQAQTIERNGMGIPLYTAQEDASAPDMAAGLAMAKAWRSGEAAGAAVPFGANLVLRGVEGTLPDAEPAIRYHDEQVARAVLAHFLNLGTQTGSWALGTTFADFFTVSLQTLARQVADVGTAHIIEDLVDANWGENEPAPRLTFDEIGSRQAATAAAIKSLVDAGVIRPDEVLEESSRQQYGLPPADPSTARTPPGASEVPMPPDNPSGVDDGMVPYGGESVAASADVLGEDVDELADSIIDALAEWVESQLPDDIAARAKRDVTGELRIPGGKGGGRWTKNPVTNAIAKALEAWGRGLGPDDPFVLDGVKIDREPLRRAARARGIELRPRASREEIVAALKDDARGEVKDGREAKAARESSAKFSITHDGKRIDVAVYTDAATGKKAILREQSDDGRPGRIITSQSDLAGLEKWAGDRGHTDIAGWAAKERGGTASKATPAPPKPPAKRVPAKKAAAKVAGTTPHPDEVAARLREIGDTGTKEQSIGYLTDLGLSVQQYKDLARELHVPLTKNTKAGIIQDISFVHVEGRMRTRAVHHGMNPTAPTDADVLSAYQRLDTGGTGGWVSVADLRKELGGTRAEQDATLIKLRRTPGVSIVPEDNQKALTPNVREGAVRIGLQDHHYISIEPQGAAAIRKGGAAAVSVSPAEMDAAIADAYGRLATRDRDLVSLTKLREQLPGAREEQDAALTRLRRMPGGSVMPNEDQKTLTAADRAAAAHIGGRANHVVAMDADTRAKLAGAKAPAKAAKKATPKLTLADRPTSMSDLATELDSLATTREKRARLRAYGFSLAEINELAPLARGRGGARPKGEGGAATPVPIHDLFKADTSDATIEAALRDVYEGKFGPYTTKVKTFITRAGTRVDKRGRTRAVEPSIGVDGKIYDSAGHEIGYFGHSIEPVEVHYTDGTVRRELWAHTGIVQLDEDKQGKGFGREFNRRAVDWYRASGVHGISHSDHNGYHWAAQGFDFSGGVMPDYKVEQLREVLTALRAGATKDKYNGPIPKQLREAPNLDEQISAAEELLARLATTKPGQPGYPTAYEVSQLGRRAGQRGKTATWLGKFLGVSADQMILNPDEGEVIGG